MKKIVVLYFSRSGNTRRMANQIGRGINSIDGCEALIRTVADIPQPNSTPTDQVADQIDSPVITKEELRNADGLIVGSPTRFGNMAAPLKHFFDSTSDVWLAGDLIDKPGAVFTSSSSMHGGQESTLFTMMLPLLHHGMIMIGIPYSEASLSKTTRGGTPYGASHVASDKAMQPMDQHEKTLCTALGARVAKTAIKLS